MQRSPGPSASRPPATSSSCPPAARATTGSRTTSNVASDSRPSRKGGLAAESRLLAGSATEQPSARQLLAGELYEGVDVVLRQPPSSPQVRQFDDERTADDAS